MRRNGRAIQRLTVTDFDDRALLAIVEDHADHEGWASTEDIATKVFGSGGSEERRLHAMRCVGIRFAWLRRYGVVENKDRQWRLTEAGLALLYGTKRLKETQRAVQGALDGDLLHLAMEVGDRYRSTNEIAQTLMRRAMVYQMGRK